MVAKPMTTRTFAALAALALAAGCVGVDSEAEDTIAEQRVALPVAIVVQDFAISPDGPVAATGATPEAASGSSDAGQAAQRFSESLTANLIAQIRKMGLPAIDSDAPLPSTGGVISLEGQFVSVPGGDSVEPAIVTLAQRWPEAVVGIDIYDTSDSGDRLVEDLEFRVGDSNPLIPRGAAGSEPTAPAASEADGQAVITPAIQAKLDAASQDVAQAIARQLEPIFADQGWIARPASS